MIRPFVTHSLNVKVSSASNVNFNFAVAPLSRVPLSSSERRTSWKAACHNNYYIHHSNINS